MTKKEAKEKIKELDEELSLLTDSWKNATNKKKERFYRMIEKGLDDRIELMKIRDTKI